MCLAISTRPDTIYTVCKLTQYNTNPGLIHWKAVQHLFHYLKGTLNLKLTYRNDGSKMSSELFQAYSDAGHAGCLDTRQSTSGFVIKMGSGAVSWSAKKQMMVADSSNRSRVHLSIQCRLRHYMNVHSPNRTWPRRLNSLTFHGRQPIHTQGTQESRTSQSDEAH